MRTCAPGRLLEAPIKVPVLARITAGALVAVLVTTACPDRPAPAHAGVSADESAAAALAYRERVQPPASRTARRGAPPAYGPQGPQHLAAGRPVAVPVARKVRPAPPARVVVARPAVARQVVHRPPARTVRHRPVSSARRSTVHRAAHRSTARPARVQRTTGRGAGAVVAYAYAQIGKPYVWGAAGPRAFDCSGLTLRAFARAGKHLAHKAARQNGRTVTRSAARPGDLVKWGSYHVGVYVGDGWVIHAPEPGRKIQKARLWGAYRIVRVLS